MNTPPTSKLPSPTSFALGAWFDVDAWVYVSIVLRKLKELSVEEIEELIKKLRTMKTGKCSVRTALQKSVNVTRRALSKNPENTTFMKSYTEQTELLVKCKGDIQKLLLQIANARKELLKAKAKARKARKK
jgi:hypothetical protein